MAPASSLRRRPSRTLRGRGRPREGCVRSHLRRWTTTGTGSRLGDETGDIVTGWLLRLVVFMAILAFLGYEAITIGMNYIGSEDAAQEVARMGRSAYRETRDEDRAEELAQAEAEFRDVELVLFEITDEHVTVEVTRTADTLITHEIGFLEGLTERTATSNIRWRD